MCFQGFFFSLILLHASITTKIYGIKREESGWIYNPIILWKQILMFVSRWFSVMKQLLHSYFRWVIVNGSAIVFALVCINA